MLKYCVIDLETNGVTKHKRFCNALVDDHTIQLWAAKPQRGKAFTIEPITWEIGFERQSQPFDFVCDISVGQNFKFDMLWFWNHSSWQSRLLQMRVWDTQTVQYLIDGQDDLPRHLDDLARKYGGVVKDDRIKTMYQAGMQSKDIPRDMLIPYAMGDVENTEKVFVGQFKIAKKRNMLPLIKAYMQHYLAITEIEYNGMFVDIDKLKEMEKALIEEIDIKRAFIIENSQGAITNPNSPQQIAQYVFWDKKHSADEKNLSAWLKETEGDENIVQLHKTKRAVVRAILELREKNKLLTTYVNKVELYKTKAKEGQVRKESGLMCMIHKDGCIHSEYQTAYTASGRLSSRNPNMQNIPPSMMSVFVSRYGDDGCIMEVDFSQLEVCVAAQLSQDSLLISEIVDGIDFHRRNAAFLYEIPEEEVTLEQRKITKNLTFALLYGAHAGRMVDYGVEKELAQRFIDGFYDKYLDFKEWHQSLEQEVILNSRITNKELILKDKTGSWLMQHKSYITMPWGKRYVFYDKGVRTKRGGVFRYWPITDIKNYPVQGTASDVVALMVGRLWKTLLPHRDKALLVNEVHDAVLLDVRKEHVKEIGKLVKRELEDIDKAWKECYNLQWVVPLKVEVKYGKSWLSCKEKK